MKKNERLNTYGCSSDTQILNSISRCCDILGNGKHNASKLLMEKTISHESHLGNYPDKSLTYGEGVSQFDEKTFYDIVDRTKKEHKNIVLKYYGFDIDQIKYSELRYNLELQIVMTRLKYKKVTAPIPISDDEQYEYYKEYWNSDLGKANRVKWDNDTKDCYFSVGD